MERKDFDHLFKHYDKQNQGKCTLCCGDVILL